MSRRDGEIVAVTRWFMWSLSGGARLLVTNHKNFVLGVTGVVDGPFVWVSQTASVASSKQQGGRLKLSLLELAVDLNIQLTSQIAYRLAGHASQQSSQLICLIWTMSP